MTPNLSHLPDDRLLPPVPEPPEQRLARLLAEALRTQADSRRDATYVGPDLPDEILLQGGFDLEQAVRILATAWPRPLPWRRRQMLLPLLMEALRRQVESRDSGAFLGAYPDGVLLDGWWDLEAALSYVLAAMPPDAAPRRTGLRFLTGSPRHTAG